VSGECVDGTSETRLSPRPFGLDDSAATSSAKGAVAVFFFKMFNATGFTLRALKMDEGTLFTLFWLPNCDGRMESLDEGILIMIGLAFVDEATEAPLFKSIPVGVLTPAGPMAGESVGVPAEVFDLTDTIAGLPLTMVCAGMGLTTALSL